MTISTRSKSIPFGRFKRTDCHHDAQAGVDLLQPRNAGHNVALGIGDLKVVADQLKGKVDVRQRPCRNRLRLHHIAASIETEELVVGDSAGQIQRICVFTATRAGNRVAAVLAASATEVSRGSARTILGTTDIQRTGCGISVLSTLGDGIAGP